MAQQYQFWYCFAILHPNNKRGYLQDVAESTLPSLHFPISESEVEDHRASSDRNDGYRDSRISWRRKPGYGRRHSHQISSC